ILRTCELGVVLGLRDGLRVEQLLRALELGFGKLRVGASLADDGTRGGRSLRVIRRADAREHGALLHEVALLDRARLAALARHLSERLDIAADAKRHVD